MDNIIDHDWGKEIVWTSNRSYCGKILIFKEANKSTPLHFHRDKNKSWFVNAGKFLVTWIDTKDGQAYSQELTEGGVFEVPSLLPVKLSSLQENSAMAECNDSVEEDYFILGK